MIPHSSHSQYPSIYPYYIHPKTRFFPYSSPFWFPHVRPTGAPGLGAPVAPRVLTPPAPHRGAGLGANAAECRGDFSAIFRGPKGGNTGETRAKTGGFPGKMMHWLMVTGTMEFYDFPYIGKNNPN